MIHGWEIENYLEIKNGQLHIDGVSAVDLANEHGTPLFVFSRLRILHNVARLQAVKGSISCTLKICYAAKANSNMAILRTVKDSGIDVEVNSGGELWKALKIGFRPEQIIFNGTSKEVWEIENSINAGIYAIQVDSVFELTLIEETARRLSKRANVSLRLVPEIESKTHSGLQTALLTSKFGMMPDEAFAAFREYKHSSHLDLAGIHLHIGSQNPHAAPYSRAFKMLFESLVRIHEDTGVRLKHINLGGGFPVNYLRDNSHAIDFPQERLDMFSAALEPAEVLQEAWEVVKASAASAGASHLLEDLTLLLEPGRSIVADAGICLTTVRNAKHRPVGQHVTEGRGGSLGTASNLGPPTTDHWLLTDAGYNILLSMETYKWYYQMISAGRSSEAHNVYYKVAGPLCDGGDVYFDIEGMRRLPDHRLLPENVRPGEILALFNCGAYSLATASQYNGRFLPAVVLVGSDGNVEVVRTRDSFDDLVNNEIW